MKTFVNILSIVETFFVAFERIVGDLRAKNHCNNLAEDSRVKATPKTWQVSADLHTHSGALRQMGFFR